MVVIITLIDLLISWPTLLKKTARTQVVVASYNPFAIVSLHFGSDVGAILGSSLPSPTSH